MTRTEQQLHRLQAALAAETRPAYRELYERARQLLADLLMAEVCRFWLDGVEAIEDFAPGVDPCEGLSDEEVAERINFASDLRQLRRRWSRFWWRFEALENLRAGRRAARSESLRRRLYEGA